METILITGANRGLGLEFVRQYAPTGATLLACCRDPQNASELQALQKHHANIRIYPLDISNTQDIQKLASQIQEPIDILINNAGILEKEEGFGNLSTDTFVQTFLINSIAPLKMTEAFSKQVAKSNRKLIVCISSSMGSIGENSSGNYYSYRTSKAALNMAMKTAAFDLAPQGINVLLLHPGWVKTRMGGEDAAIEPAKSIAGMRKVIENYQPKPAEVAFYRFDGTVVAW